MNIGIITFQRANNYGAILQCYALYHVLNNIDNINVQVIDYRNDYIENQYKIFPNYKISLSLCKSIIKNVFLFSLLNKKNNNFNLFRDLLNFSSSYTKNSLLNNDNTLDYDVIIAGSDQIWNPQITNGFDDIYYLNFPGNFHRTTYAMSMGNILNSMYLDPKFKEMISKFDYISMRENDATEFVSKLLSKKTFQVLDPTLLVSKNEWSTLIKQITINVPKRYILLYYVESNNELFSIAEKLSIELNIPVVYLDFKSKLKLKCKSISQMDAGPLEFIKLIKDAEIVVTSSFHATAFSCIFEKDIHLMTHSTTGARVLYLASMFNINDRVYCSYEDFISKYSTQTKITYSKEEFNTKYKQSIDYLNIITSFSERKKND